MILIYKIQSDVLYQTHLILNYTMKLLNHTDVKERD